VRVETGRAVGDFVVDGPLGSGGMAQVWVATDIRTGGRVALKVARSAEARLRARMLREGRAQSSLSHPNLLPVLGTIVDAEQVVLVLPLVQGPSLDAQLDQGRLTADEALAVLIGVARGLAHAHRAGFVHRDVKPSNILLDLQDGVVPRVSDFGLVKTNDPLLATMQGASLGTPAYAAPEQLRDASKVDQRADLWSLGVVLVELYSGRAPPHVVTGAREEREPLSLDGLPPEVARLAEELLQPDPARRLASCGVLVARLEALLGPVDPLAAGGRLATLLDQQVTARRAVAAADTWAEDELRSRLHSAAVERPVARPVSVGDFFTRHDETVVREGGDRLHLGRIALALLAAVGALVVGARC
jgi:serine/threonine protein kinase